MNLGMELSDELKYMLEQYEINVNELINKFGTEKITRKDVEDYIKEMYFPRVKILKKLDPVRKVIARRLASSYDSAVHVTLFKTINVEPLLSAKEKLESILGGKVTFTFTLLKPLARVLDGSIFNSELRGDDEVIMYEDVNIAIAVQTKKGLVTPVIRRVSEKSLKTLYKEYVDIISRARSLKLKQKDLVGGTFTLSNLGMYGTDYFTQIINPPQIAILGVGKIKEELTFTPSSGLKTIKVATFSLTFDHRVADGADAAAFLAKLENEIKTFIENCILFEG
ncbi:MAG: 2-oxo acid dehydrogenase subunit E2 [Thermofilum sp.]|nr:2-oxo acid dehydrogenase subunit E2 [Thermofilum sp.]